MGTDRTQPLLLGYVRRQLAATDRDLADAIELVTRFAAREGFILDEIFVERLDASLAAFRALVDAIDRDGWQCRPCCISPS